MYTDFNRFFTVTTRNVWRIKANYPATSPSFCNHPTYQHTTLLLVWMLHSWFIGVNGPSAILKVTVILINQSINQSSLGSSEIAVFDMSTAILHKTFKTTTPLIDATVNGTLLLGDYRSLQFFHRVKFSLMKSTPNSIIHWIKIRSGLFGATRLVWKFKIRTLLPPKLNHCWEGVIGSCVEGE